MKKIYSLFMILCLLFVMGCDAKEKLYYSSPGVIPNTERQMKSPGFWISRQPLADKVILDPAEIIAFNAKTENELGLTENLSALGGVYSGEELFASLAKDMQGMITQKLYAEDGKQAGAAFYRRMEDEINSAAIPPEIAVRYGFICRYTDERILPTDEVLTAERGDTGFDELQNSSLDIGAGVAVLHETKNGVWAYVQSQASEGWVKKSSIAFCSPEEYKDYSEKAPFVVVTAAKADIFLDNALTQYLDYVRMGARFSYTGDMNAGVVQITIPTRTEEGKFVEKTAYIKRSDVNPGYLPYTPRVIIDQAFKLYNAPYGWGGKNGEQDCSSFLQEVFSTVGILLPRNSSDQGQVGRPLGEFVEKEGSDLKLSAIKDQAIAGATIMQLDGHIFLYLGMYEGQPYVIHDTHAYRQKVWWGDRIRQVNRVVVSDLTLGKGSSKGSLLERIIAIRTVN